MFPAPGSPLGMAVEAAAQAQAAQQAGGGGPPSATTPQLNGGGLDLLQSLQRDSEDARMRQAVRKWDTLKS